MSTRKIEGQAKTWEEPIGVLRATFCQGTSEVREWLGHVPATLIIGKGYTEEEEEVKAMLIECRDAAQSVAYRNRLTYIAAKHGIVLNPA